MKKNGLRLFLYRLPLKRALAVRSLNQSLFFREGLILQRTCDDGSVRWGEIAPLPGLTPETLSDAIEQIQNLLTASPFYRSVQFGLDQIEMEKASFPQEITINALIPDLQENGVRERARQVQNQGFKTVKLKVGTPGRTVEQEVEKVWQVKEILGSRTCLRLDANRAWNLNEASQFCKAIEKCEIEYLEEPLRDPNNLDSLARRTTCPIALDETLISHPEFLNHTDFPLAAVVLKPTALGGIAVCREIAARARSSGAKAVVSSCFETGIGTSALLSLARSFDSEVAAGLDPYLWLRQDLLKAPLTFLDGTLRIESFDVRTDLLEEVPLR